MQLFIYFIYFVLLNDTVSTLDHTASNDNDQWTGKGVEGSSSGITKVLSQNFLGVSEENHGNLSQDSRSPRRDLTRENTLKQADAL
jgi:hypothetical protein